MPTPFVEVYDYFHSQIDDQEFLEIDEDDALAYRYLKNAITNFRKARVSLEMDEMGFIENLSGVEIAIIGELMVLEYLAPQLKSLTLLQQGMNTRDFTKTSQAAHLNALLSLKKDMESKVKTRMVQYTHDNNDVSLWK